MTSFETPFLTKAGLLAAFALALSACGQGFSAAEVSTLTSASVGPVSPVGTNPATPINPATPSTPPPFTSMDLKQSIYAAYGDSITAAGTYVNLLNADAGASVLNFARSGQLTCNIAVLEVFAQRVPQTTDGARYVTVMEGTNDANTQEVGLYERNFNACQRASLTWLAVPTSSKAIPRVGSACVTTGTWAPDSFEASSLTSTTSGSTMDCALPTTGGPLYLWYKVADDNGGSFTYAIDGGAPTSVVTASAISLANSNGTDRNGVFMIRVPGVSAGVHHVVFKVTSPTAPANAVTLWGIGTPPSTKSASTAPRVFLTGVIRQVADARAAQTATYDANARANAAFVAADGLPVSFVDLRSYLSGATNEMADFLHPNDLGHARIRDAFKAVITGQAGVQ